MRVFAYVDLYRSKNRTAIEEAQLAVQPAAVRSLNLIVCVTVCGCCCLYEVMKKLQKRLDRLWCHCSQVSGSLCDSLLF